MSKAPHEEVPMPAAQAYLADEIKFTPAYAPDAEEIPALPPTSKVGPLEVAEAAATMIGTAAETSKPTEKPEQIVTSANPTDDGREKTVKVVGGAEVAAKEKSPKEKNRIRKFIAGIALGVALLTSGHNTEPVDGKALQPPIEQIAPSDPTAGTGAEKPPSPLVKGGESDKVLAVGDSIKTPQPGTIDNGLTQDQEALNAIMEFGTPTDRDLKPFTGETPNQ